MVYHRINIFILFISFCSTAFGDINLQDRTIEVERLTGTWTFYPELLLHPNELNEHEGKTVTLPEKWNDHHLPFSGSFLNFNVGKGAGTYSTVVNLNPHQKCDDFQIETRRIKMNYRLFFDDIEAGSVGLPGYDSETSVDLYYPRMWQIPSTVNCHSFRLTLQVSNFSYPKGGIDGPILIGDFYEMQRNSSRLIAIRMISAGFILLTSVVAFVFYMAGRKADSNLKGKPRSLILNIFQTIKVGLFDYSTFDEGRSIRKYTRANAYFMFYTAFLSVRLFVESEKIANLFFEHLGPNVTLRMDLIGVFIGFPMIIFYMNQVLPGYVHRWVLKCSAVYMLILTPLGLTSLYLLGKLLLISHIYVLASLVYMMTMSIKAIIHKRENATLFFVSVFVVFLGAANDILYDMGVYQWYYVVNICISIFCALNLFLLSRDIYSSYLHLEDRVREQTQKYLELYSTREGRLDQEKMTIARDMHDSVNTSVFVLKSRLEELDTTKLTKETQEEINDLRIFANKTYKTLRWFVSKLHPELIDDIGLAAALKELCAQYNTERTQVIYQEKNYQRERLTSHQENQLYMIAKEAITNGIKHGEPAIMSVLLRVSSNGLTLKIEDNGKGFDANNSRIASHGLHSMESRATGLGAHLKLDSQSGNGCEISVSLVL